MSQHNTSTLLRVLFPLLMLCPLVGFVSSCTGDKTEPESSDVVANLRELCGVVGSPCCQTEDPCEWGSVCDGPGLGTCKATAMGASCETPNQCAGSLTCEGGNCCQAQGTLCVSSKDCCGGLMCRGSGVNATCEPPPSNCGSPGQPCCAGSTSGTSIVSGPNTSEDNRCASRSTCNDSDRCEPCGDQGQACCAGTCGSGGACSSGSCFDLFACGGEGEPCCPATSTFVGGGGNNVSLDLSTSDGGSCRGELLCGASGKCAGRDNRCGGLSCLECRAQPGCGYCEGGGGCVPGGGDGPASGSCRGDWIWNALECPGAPELNPRGACDARNAFQCARLPGCGWCGDAYVGSCRPGGRNGPSSSSSSCPTNCWSHRQSPPAECALGLWDSCARLDRQACYQQSECGWCGNEDNGTCREGNRSGPRTGTCCWSYDRANPGQCPLGVPDATGPEDVDINVNDVPGLGRDV